jgi:hypothetical protein
VAVAGVALVSMAVVSVVAVLAERRSRTSWASAGGGRIAFVFEFKKLTFSFVLVLLPGAGGV